MPLIDTTSLLRIADRAAYQYEQLKTVLAAISVQGTAYYFETVTDTDDKDVEIPTLGPYSDTDADFSAVLAAAEGTKLGNIITGMEAHFDRQVNGAALQAGGWDGYLTSKDKRVSEYFAELFYAIHRYFMIANNVFSENDDQFAELEVITGPLLKFTDGVNYGNGDSQNPANGSYYAATQLRVVVTSMGSTNLDLRLSVKDENDDPTTIDVTVPGNSDPGDVIVVGGASDRFLDVTGSVFKPAGSGGTVGDKVTVRNKKERQIVL